MKAESLLEKIKTQFEEKIDAGLIFKINPEEYNTCFFFEDDIKPEFRFERRTNQFDIETVDKQDVYRYLTAKFLKINIKGHYSRYNDSDFYEKFWLYWLGEHGKIVNTLALVDNYYSVEQINISDLIISNVEKRDGYYYQARIHIISQKYITEILIDEKNLCHRVEHLIQRDIKRIEAKNKHLCVYFHGIHDPFVILFDTYEEVIKLQRHLLELRNSQHYPNRKDK